jgi:hypothetical protein
MTTPSADVRHLGNELASGNVVLFIGAGVSAAAGAPTWTQLVAPLAGDVGRALGPAPSAQELLDILAVYETVFGRNALARRLRDSLARTTATSSIHDVIARLYHGVPVITTNYDRLLEMAYQAAGAPLNVVLDDQGLPYWDSGVSQLMKLRGDVGAPDSMVITKRDYDLHPLRNPLIHQQLQMLLATKTALFLGYSHSDPDTDLVWNLLHYRVGANIRSGVSIQFDISPADAAMWEKLHVGVRLLIVTSALGKAESVVGVLEQVAGLARRRPP